MMWDSYIHDREETSRKKGMREGKNEANLATAKNLLNMGFSQQDISKVTGLSIAKIKAIKI